MKILFLLSCILSAPTARSETIQFTTRLIPKVSDTSNERGDHFALRYGPIFTHQFQNRELTTHWSVAGETATYAVGSQLLSFDVVVDAVVSGEVFHPIQVDFNVISRIQPSGSHMSFIWNHVSSHRQAGIIANGTDLDHRKLNTTGSSDIGAFEVRGSRAFTAGLGIGTMDQTANTVPRLLQIPGILYNEIGNNLGRHTVATGPVVYGSRSLSQLPVESRIGSFLFWDPAKRIVEPVPVYSAIALNLEKPNQKGTVVVGFTYLINPLDYSVMLYVQLGRLARN